MEKIKNANIVVTDSLMETVYGADAIDGASVSVLKDPEIFALNVLATPEKVFSLLAPLSPKPLFICGSSNFHHVDAYNIAQFSRMLASPMQLILIDRHMDCQRYRDSENVLHCGNWVSYCYRKGYINRIVMAGCDDYSKVSTFDHQIKQDGNLLHAPDLNSIDIRSFLDAKAPTYTSVDTDVLDVLSDWGVGRHSMESVMASPLWEQLQGYKVVGGFINGHVTDDRRLKDMLVCAIINIKASSVNMSFREICEDTYYTMKDKLKASLSGSPLKPEAQLQIILRFYERITGVIAAEQRIPD